MFLMPAIGVNFSNMPSDFVSCYLIDDKTPKLVMVMTTEKSENPISAISAKITAKLSHTETLSGGGEVAYFYDFPDQYIIDYNLFTIGRYTKFSLKYKDLLLNHYGRLTGAGNNITMVDALYPDADSKQFRAKQLGVKAEDLPNGEVMSVPNMDQELYDVIVYKINNSEKKETV
jgi:hypothetical protein